MTLLKISICSFVLSVILIWPVVIKSQPIAIRAGIYDFTDITASEFYLLAPTILLGYDVWKKSRVTLNLSTGISFNSVKYDEYRNYLYMVPLMLTVNYDLPNPNASVWPVIGMGISALGTANKNRNLVKTYYSLAYGFPATGGLRFRLNKKLVFTFDLTYNLLIPPVSENVNLNGIIITIGLRLPVK